MGNTGVGLSHGQTAGDLGSAFEPFYLGADPSADAPEAVRAAFDLASEPARTREAYGISAFGRNCLLARRLVEAGARVVTVNMFETVFNRVTWDCHGARPFSTLDDYRRELLPGFDAAFTALLDDLTRSGRLGSTLVVATGEFGRSPRINASGGRDHWPGAWSALLAGGGVRGGQVIGATDAHAAEPADRTVKTTELLTTIYSSLDLDPAEVLGARAAQESWLPITEAFA
jgi:uncharacterized protein (DUF1501 family)